MSFNIVDMVKAYLTQELSSKVATKLGESESRTMKAIAAALPTILGALATNGSADGGSIFDKIKAFAGSGILGNLGSLIGANSTNDHNGIGSLLGGLLGDKKEEVAQGIASFSGVSASSAHSILNVTSGAALGAVGKYATDNHLDLNGFSSLMTSQKENISSIIPTDFSISDLSLGAIGIGSSAAASATNAAAHVSSVASSINASKNSEFKAARSGKIAPILFLLAGLTIAYFGYKSCNENSIEGKTPQETTTEAKASTESNDEQKDTATTSTIGTVDSMGNFVYNLGNMTKIDLPNGAGTLEVGENSTEAKLVRFLLSSDAVDTAKGNWFDFTNVRFKTGSADITDESMTQLKNMVAIAKAFPNAAFKVGGYTDNTGDESKNVALSKKRAAVVAAKIIAMGASSKSIISSDGYGSQFPIGDNATAEGKAQNRRVSVNVKAK